MSAGRSDRERSFGGRLADNVLEFWLVWALDPLSSSGDSRDLDSSLQVVQEFFQ